MHTVPIRRGVSISGGSIQQKVSLEHFLSTLLQLARATIHPLTLCSSLLPVMVPVSPGLGGDDVGVGGWLAGGGGGGRLLVGGGGGGGG